MSLPLYLMYFAFFPLVTSIMAISQRTCEEVTNILTKHKNLNGGKKSVP